MEFEIETLDASITYDDDAIDELLRAFTRLGVDGVSVSHGGDSGIGASFSVTVDGRDGEPEAVYADSARAGLDLFERACEKAGIHHGPIAKVSVLTEEMLDLEVNRPPETFLGVAEVAKTLGVSRQRVAELRVKPEFPAPIAELAAGPVWKASSLGRFTAEWDRKPGRPRKRTA